MADQEKETTPAPVATKPKGNGSLVTIVSRANYSVNLKLTDGQTVIVPPNGRIDVDNALINKSQLSSELKLVGAK